MVQFDNLKDEGSWYLFESIYTQPLASGSLNFFIIIINVGGCNFMAIEWTFSKDEVALSVETSSTEWNPQLRWSSRFPAMRKLSRCPIPNRLRFLRRYTQSH
jgi:hypothetical protein